MNDTTRTAKHTWTADISNGKMTSNVAKMRLRLLVSMCRYVDMSICYEISDILEPSELEFWASDLITWPNW